MGYQRITASVGKHSGGKQCYNYPADQAVVQNLLNAIPAWQGGQEGRLADPIRAGMTSASLQYAIERFQRQQGLSQDGHIDPNGAAIKKLNLLASGAPPIPGPPKREVVHSGDPIPPPGFSESGSTDPSAGSSSRGSIQLKEVLSGFAPAVKSFQGGPAIAIHFQNRSASAVSVTVTLTSLLGSYKRTITIPRFQSSAGPSWNHGASPPISWNIEFSVGSIPAGWLAYSVRTDWRPGDPV